jgi:hypothetical protein
MTSKPKASSLIALFAMQIGMHPQPLDTLVPLCGLVRPRPISLGIPPQPGEGVSLAGGSVAVSDWRNSSEVILSF